jgi:hypothetical protein
MATLAEIQKQLDDKTFDPGKLTPQQRRAIDSAIQQGFLKGPTTSQLIAQRKGAARDVATMDAASLDPIGVKLQKDDSAIKGRNSAILAGDLIGSIYPYVADRKKIFSAAKSKIPGNKDTGLFPRSKIFNNFADKLTARLPGRFKLLGGAVKLLAKVADPTVGRVLASPLGRTEIKSVLGGTAGAGVGSVTYDALNETAGVAVMDAIASDMENMNPKEVNTNMLANASDAMFTALAWNAGAATLTPFITKGFGKLGRLAIGAKSKDAKQLVGIARDKGLPLPLVMTAQEGVGLLGGFANKFFKVLGIMPFINGIGKEALQGAERTAGKNYLNTSVLTYGPLIKTGMLSASVFKQADEAFKQNSKLINDAYTGFESLANYIGNPKVIELAKTKAFAKDMVDRLALNYPGLRQYATDALGELPQKEVEKLLRTGDPLTTFYRYVNSLDDMVSPLQYKELMKIMNRAIEDTAYVNIRPSLWALREGLETDLNMFGKNITKEQFFKDETFKTAYEQLAATAGKETADANLTLQLKQATDLKNQLYRANDTFSTLMNFYERANITKIFRQYDNTKFTNKALAGITGLERGKAQNFFRDLANDVFTHGDSQSIKQLRQLLGADKIISKKTGQAIGITKGGGEALFNSMKARWMFNTFYRGFDSSLTPGGRTMMDDIMGDATVRTGINGTVDVMQSMKNIAKAGQEEILDFSIDKVRRGDGILDVQKIKFSPKDTSRFNINRFLRELGIQDPTNDVAKEKLVSILGGRGQAKEFEKFLTYMKAISDTPIADTSTFMQRRLQLGGLNSFAGAMVLGGSAAVNPFAPALFILLARRFGQIATDPIAMKAWNDALNPEEQIALLTGKKLGDGVPGLLGIGRRYFKGRDIQTAANILQSPGVIGRLGLTQKREAFARVMNYLNDSDTDVPRINPKDVSPEEITERLLQLDTKVPDPQYNEKTLPTKTFETLFAYDNVGSSGNVETDNNAVAFLDSSTQNELLLDAEEQDVASEEKLKVFEDLQLENPDMTPPTAPVAPATGPQVNARTFEALFPNDPTGAAIARKSTGNV